VIFLEVTRSHSFCPRTTTGAPKNDNKNVRRVRTESLEESILIPTFSGVNDTILHKTVSFLHFRELGYLCIRSNYKLPRNVVSCGLHCSAVSYSYQYLFSGRRRKSIWQIFYFLWLSTQLNHNFSPDFKISGLSTCTLYWKVCKQYNRISHQRTWLVLHLIFMLVNEVIFIVFIVIKYRRSLGADVNTL
jgi:hypothetical protein